MKKRTGIFILLQAAVIFLLSGCSSNPQLTACDVSFVEERGTLYNSFPNGGQSAVQNNVTYYFANDLTEEQMYDYIHTTDKILKKMAKTIDMGACSYEIYICSEEYSSSVKEHTLYTSYLDFETKAYVTALANMVLGNEVNYGIVCGFSMDIAKSMGYETVNGDITEAIALYDSEPEYFDLNYACFSPYYVEEETIEKLEIISDAYYQFLKKEEKTDILQAYSPEKQREYLNAFLTLYEKAPYDNSDLDMVFVYR